VIQEDLLLKRNKQNLEDTLEHTENRWSKWDEEAENVAKLLKNILEKLENND
jgi:hypothetical protein